ncbi:sesquiterpene cyclase [Streptomyces hygroscopicus]|uniref:(-)-alpha-amorphene synthase n=1 Tax=Streptomyces hygroscopicus TaxID=1912 RepID=UPI00223FCB96|nr:(-)-alpha-amorphene synthase [Streptomyces hygroscopicus]MCW7941280.1 sesquiterpene cyclase [Streptomyces hygroscopicus]
MVRTTSEGTAAASDAGVAARSLKELIEAELHMPFPLLSSPHESEVAAGVDNWLRDRGLSDDPQVTAMIAYTRPAELASRSNPTMDPGLLQIAANQIAYQFVFDDHAEDVGRRRPSRLLPMLCESIGILRDDQPPSTPLGAALADLHRQVRERCTPAQAARWAWNSREYVHGLLYEAVAQTDPRRIRIGLCGSIRSLTAGVEPFHPLCEAAQPAELPPEELFHPAVLRLRRLSADAAVWIPDLFSAVKERRAGGVINLALAYHHAYDCSLPEAVGLAIRRINDTIREFERLFEETRPELSPDAIGYVEGVAGWIGGCYHWSRSVPRYADTATVPVGP